MTMTSTTLNATGATKADVAKRESAIKAPRDPRAMVSPLTGQVIGTWKGQVTR